VYISSLLALFTTLCAFYFQQKSIYLCLRREMQAGDPFFFLCFAGADKIDQG
jgi:hypothetical protein